MISEIDFLSLLDENLKNSHPLLPRIQAAFYQYYKISLKWGDKINITRNLTPESFIEENLIDPILALKALSAYDEGISSGDFAAIDVGCGGGFVGLVWAVLSESRGRFILLDSDRRKINFCKEAIRHLSLKNVIVKNARLEEFILDEKCNFNFVLSRATWAPHIFFEKCAPLLLPRGRLIHFSSLLQSSGIDGVLKLEYVFPKTGIRRFLSVLSPSVIN